jgi:hypothetical protein
MPFITFPLRFVLSSRCEHSRLQATSSSSVFAVLLALLLSLLQVLIYLSVLCYLVHHQLHSPNKQSLVQSEQNQSLFIISLYTLIQSIANEVLANVRSSKRRRKVLHKIDSLQHDGKVYVDSLPLALCEIYQKIGVQFVENGSGSLHFYGYWYDLAL